MTAGRRPKPTRLKLITGNPGNRPLNDQEPKPSSTNKPPRVPAGMGPIAARKWRQLSKDLHALGLLTKIDLDSLMLYCDAYARYCDAQRLIRTHGQVVKSPNGMPCQAPWVGVANTAAIMMTKLAVEFGMTPSARSRVKAEPIGSVISDWARLKT